MGALVEIVEVSLAEQAPPGLRGCFLDQPRAGAVLDAQEVDVIGWALGAERRALAVEFAHRGETVWRAKLRSPRSDLAAAYPDCPEAASAGFATTLDLLGTAAEFELDVSAVLAGRERGRVPIATIRGRHRWRRDRDPAFAELVSVMVSGRSPQEDSAAALESVRAQTYRRVEMVVVDDLLGAAARNAGIRRSNGDFLVFLDAGARLSPGAIATAVEALAGHPECAAAAAGLPTAGESPYESLLRRAATGFGAGTVYRRALFEHVRGFDPELGGAAALGFDLAVARQFRVCGAGEVITEREAGTAVAPAADARSALRRQRRFVRRDPDRRRAYREGRRRLRALGREQAGG